MTIPPAEFVRGYTAAQTTCEAMAIKIRDVIFAQARLGLRYVDIAVPGMTLEARKALVSQLTVAGYAIQENGTIGLIIRW